MRDSRGKSLAVGLTTVVALTMIGVGVFLVGTEQKLWQGRTSYRLHFTRTNGLQESAPVALDGVNVGRVASMNFPKDPRARYVEVKIHVSSSVMQRIRKDTTARILTLGLLGDKYIELSSGSLTEPPIVAGDLIQAVDPTDYEAIIGQGGDVVSNAIEVTGLLREVLTDIHDGEGLVGRILKDPEFGLAMTESIARAIEHLESATATVDGLLIEAREGRGNLGTLLVGESRVASILEHLDAAATDARTFTEKLNTGDGTIQRLVNDHEYAERTLGNIQRATSSIAEVTSQVRSGKGSLGKLVYDDELHERANAWLGGGGTATGGFWRLLGRTLGFFLPPGRDPKGSELDADSDGPRRE